MIGLGVGVDYALFVVTRFREELRGFRGVVPPGQHSAVNCTKARSRGRRDYRDAHRGPGRAHRRHHRGHRHAGLLVLRQTLLNGVAIAAAATVAMTVIASLTLLPALLGFTGYRLARPSRLNSFLGDKVFGRGDRQQDKTHAAERWAGVIQKHPVLATVMATAFILILAAPALVMKLSMPDESAQARGTMGYASYATMAQGFGPDSTRR